VPNAFSGLSMLSSAMRNFQRGLELTGHNISNVNTAGYTRQRMDLGANQAQDLWGPNGMYQIGNGASVNAVYRVRDLFLDGQMRDAQGDLGQFQTLAQNLKAVESVFPEPAGPGIADAMQKLFDAFSQLATNPNDPGSKLNVQLAGQTLTSKVRATYAALEGQSNGLDTQMTGAFDRVDQLTERIAQLNREIVGKQAAGAEPSDLMDQRDLALDELSGLISIQTSVFEDGSIRVSSGEIPLVQGVDNFKIPRQYDSTTQTISDGTRSFRVDSGELAGLMETHRNLRGTMTKLNDLADTMRTTFNAIHQTGKNAAGTTGIDFFNSPGSGAADFNMSKDVLSSLDNIMTGTTGKAGDGSIALSLSKLRDSAQPGLGGRTFKAFFADLLSGVGRDRAYYQNAVETQGAIVTQIEAQRQAESGVNIDEEMTNMLKYQRSYQAAAQALTVMNQVTEDLLGMLR
jgi:flagellar hook-associated protein 1